MAILVHSYAFVDQRANKEKYFSVLKNTDGQKKIVVCKYELIFACYSGLPHRSLTRCEKKMQD